MCHTFNIKGVVVLSQANIYIGLIWLLWVASPSEIHSQRLSETYHNVYCTCNVLVLSVVLLEIVNFVAFSRVLQLLSRQIWSLFVLAKTNSTLHARMLSNDRKEHSITIANLKPFHFKGQLSTRCFKIALFDLWHMMANSLNNRWYHREIQSTSSYH